MRDTESFSENRVDSDGEAAKPAALPFDPAQYQADVDCFDITDEQKQELLQTLWSIMRSFVEFGFTVDVCGALWNDPAPFQDDVGAG